MMDESGNIVASVPADGSGPMTFRAWATTLTCLFIACAEGYDSQAMAMAAPMLAETWGLRPAGVGVLLTSSFVGIALGSIMLAPFGDRIGRKPSMLIGLTIAGVFTLLAVAASTVPELLATRLIAGLGLGLAMPNLVTLALESVPPDWRVLTVVIVNCGYPLGAAAGGAIVGGLIETHGYSAIFWVGAAATAAAVLIGFLALDESPAFLRPPRPAPLGRSDLVPVRASPRQTLAALLHPERRTATLLLWLVSFAGITMIYFMTSWLPTLVASRGLAGRDAILATALFNGCGVLGAICFALILRRVGPTRILGAAYVVAGMTAVVLGLSPPVGPFFFLILALSGVSIIGAQYCLTAVVNLYYPPAIRVSGSGWALGVGRMGALFAPLIGAYTIASVSQMDDSFFVMVVPAALGLVAVLGLSRLPGFASGFMRAHSPVA